MNKHTFFSPTPTSNRHIEHNLLMLRTESFNEKDSFNKFDLNLFKETVKGIFEKFSNFEFSEGFSAIFRWYDSLNNVSLDNINRSYNTLNNKVKDLAKQKADLNFVLHNNILLPVPDGFNGNWTEYVETLIKHRESLIKTSLSSMDEFQVFISAFLSNKDSRIALQDNRNINLGKAKARIEQTKAFESFFDPNGYNQRVTVGKTFNSTADLHQGLKLSMAHWNYVKEVDLKGLKSKVSVLAERINTLIAKYENHKDIEVSKQALLNIAEGSYETACQIEHLALFVARSEMAMSTAGNMATRLLELK